MHKIFHFLFTFVNRIISYEDFLPLVCPRRFVKLSFEKSNGGFSGIIYCKMS